MDEENKIITSKIMREGMMMAQMAAAIPGFGVNRETYIRKEKKIGRNEPCPCDSGKKYKKYCINLTNQ